MPTGFTAPVKDGEITEFSQFALLCARAFSPLIMLRDEPLEAKIPDEFTPSDYCLKRTREIERRIAEWKGMTADEVEREAESRYQKQLTEWRARDAERQQARTRYRAMLDKVHAWEPPTPEHRNLKRFMQEQLADSLASDCSDRFDCEPEKVSGERLRSIHLETLHESLLHFKVEHEGELERVGARNEWVRELRKSLGLAA